MMMFDAVRSRSIQPPTSSLIADIFLPTVFHIAPKKATYRGGFCGLQRPCGRHLHQAFRGCMVVVLQPVLMAYYLAIQLVHQIIHGSV